MWDVFMPHLNTCTITLRHSDLQQQPTPINFLVKLYIPINLNSLVTYLKCGKYLCRTMKPL